MQSGGIFGASALSGVTTGGVFGAKSVAGCGAVVPDDFGVDLEQPSLPVTQEMFDEASRLEAENAKVSGAPAQSLLAGLSGTKIALVLGGVAAAVWLLTKPRRAKANRKGKRRAKSSHKRRVVRRRTRRHAKR